MTRTSATVPGDLLLMSATQVAERYGLALRKVQRAAKAGHLAGVKIGERTSAYVFTAAAVDAWIARSGAK